MTALSKVEGLADLSDKEINTNMANNAANEFNDSLIYDTFINDTFKVEKKKFNM